MAIRDEYRRRAQAVVDAKNAERPGPDARDWTDLIADALERELSIPLGLIVRIVASADGGLLSEEPVIADARHWLEAIGVPIHKGKLN